jgi:hypothetical protein
MKRDRIAEGLPLRNMIDAPRRALDEHPKCCLEAALWHEVEACSVARGILDGAMLGTGWS